MYTTAALVRTIRRYAQAPEGRALAMVEIGGANSCFLDRMLGEFGPRSYEVVDTNQYGLKLLTRMANAGGPLHLHRESVLSMSLPPKADVVFSVGLVEHFSPKDTREAVLAHFDVLCAPAAWRSSPSPRRPRSTPHHARVDRIDRAVEVSR